MDQSICETESVFVSGTATQASNSDWFHVEQTEPLDLCLNGTILNGLTMIESYPSFKENGNLSEPSDEDVIFVKEYKTTADKMLKRLNGQKAAIKGAPRRNPVRKARITKRFEEYMDVSTFEENELLDQSAEEENSMVRTNAFVLLVRKKQDLGKVLTDVRLTTVQVTHLTATF
jgi:hypothetical protein